jgi:hypothetical protein
MPLFVADPNPGFLLNTDPDSDPRFSMITNFEGKNFQLFKTLVIPWFGVLAWIN